MTCIPTSPEVLAEMFPKCVWSKNFDGDYETQCWHEYTRDPKRGGFKFCPYCGKRIEVEK